MPLAAWRDVPLGPRTVIASLVGKREVKRVADGRALRAMLPEMQTCLAVECDSQDSDGGLDKLALALGLEGYEATCDVDELSDAMVEALGTQRACATVDLVVPSEEHLQVVCAALRRNNSSWRELKILRGKDTVDFVVSVFEGLKDNREVQSLAISGMTSSISREQAEACGEALRADGSALRKLELCQKFEPGATALLLEGLEHSRTLRELALGHRDAESAALGELAALGDVLRAQQVPLEVLQVQGPLEGDAGATIANGLAHNSVLRVLNLRCSGAGPETATALGVALGFRGSRLRELNLEGNRGIGDEAGAKLAAGLASNGMLRVINLRYCSVGVETASAIGKALCFDGSALRKLELCGNPDIADHGGAELAKGLSANGVLRSLDLSSCRVGPVTAAALGGALRFERSALRRLELRNNRGIADVGGAELASGLAANCTLRELALPRARVGSATAIALGEALRYPHSALRSLDLEGSLGIGDAAGAELAKGMASNCVLSDVNLGSCALGLATATALGVALRFDRSALRALCLSGNEDIGAAGGSKLAQGLAHNHELRSLLARRCNLTQEVEDQITEAARCSEFKVTA